MAFGGAKFFKNYGAGKLPPDLLRRSIRKSIELCWLLQEPHNRSKEYVEKIILGMIAEEMRDYENVVKDL